MNYNPKQTSKRILHLQLTSDKFTEVKKMQLVK